MALAPSPRQTYIPLPSSNSGRWHADHEVVLKPVPIYIVTHESQLPATFLNPSQKNELVVGLDCEGVDLCRYGTLCIVQCQKSGITRRRLRLRETVTATLYRSAGRWHADHEVVLKPVPIYIVTHESQLPATFLNPSQKNELVVGLDCEGVDLCRYGTLCIVQALYHQFDIKLHNVMDTQIAYYLIEEQLGKKRGPDDHIYFVRLLADPRYCGISNVEKKEVRSLLREDPQFWTYRPLSELMVRAVADDVRFLPYIFHKMMEKLSEQSLWRLAVRGSLCCRCFCISDNGYADWPAIPSIPEFLNVERDTLEEEILSVLDVPARKMGCVIGRKGSSILSIKESCKAEILIGGSKGTPD